MPALAVARALAERRGTGSVEIVGSRRGTDSSLLADQDLPYTLLPGRGIARSLSARNLAENVAAVAGLCGAAAMATGLVLTRRPAVVVSVGGYASVPVAVAAVATGVPLVLVNVDSVPGAANRVMSRFARACAVAFPGTRLPRPVVTGAPVREEIAAVSRRDERARALARRSLGMPEDRVLVAVFGGSLGARRINQAALELASLWSGRGDRAIYHVVGRRDFEWAQSAAEHFDRGEPAGAAPGLVYEQVPFEKHMELVYQAADVAVCRAGAMTVAELGVTGLPAVLVPLPGAPGDHQGANARALSLRIPAIVVDDEDCNGGALANLVDRLVEGPAQEIRDEPGYAERGAVAGETPKDAARAIASVVEAHAKPRPAAAPEPRREAAASEAAGR